MNGVAAHGRNATRVLAEVRARGAAARVDIADALDLSPATVSAVVAPLIECGLVEETETAPAAGRGRPRVLLRVNPAAGRVAGAKLSDTKVTVAILDYAGDIVAEGHSGLSGPRIDVAELVERLDEALDIAISGAGIVRDDIAAFGLGVPGFVDAAAGVCWWSPVLTGANVDLLGALGARLPGLVRVDNDANLAALAELWFGLGRNERDFLVVSIEHGLGMGVVLNGALFRGARGLGAEFGHTKIQNEGALCRCGQRGCLEAYVADYAIAREAGAALGAPATGVEADLIETLVERATQGHEASVSIFRRAGRMMGLGLANLINIFDPPLVILSGERMKSHHLLAAEIERTVAANCLRGDDGPRIAIHRWGDQLWARGAGALALEGLTSAICGDGPL